MPKQFPAESEWQAPWEKNGTEFNEDVAKHLIYNLSKSEHTLEADLASATRDVNAAKREASEAASAATAEGETFKAEALYGRRVKVAIEKGIDPAKAKWLSGETPEEIGASADEYLTDHGASAPAGDGEGEGAGEGGEGAGDGAEGGAGGEPKPDPVRDFMLRRSPIDAAVLSGASRGTDGQEQQQRPASTVEDARKIVTHSR